ncbi:ABC transporter ATP-binding protein [Methylobacterium oryzihabitans]|uniref:ABC transporter ATP-binding protein n=1 Tax=Methylobacterium oryzihabitans TaxID=2499852 RepID=A0A437P8E3_9HYPH|nr:ABC transporter ATP-binding protein [Methylobacterium oryzihabitans]RVU18358.1 ABC transporter ATP-binding protein [Methylobacterium oryzihabitans]
MREPENGLVVEGLRVRYGRRIVLADLSLPPIEAGHLTVVAGPNGAGKSTFLRALAGLMPVEGSLRLDGCELVGARPADRASRVAYMPQTLPQDLGFTVLEAVLHACRSGVARPPTIDEAVSRAAATLDRLGLVTLADVLLDRLSGGQRQLTSLAQALVRRPRLLLLDEPLSALDLHHQHAVLSVLRSLATEGVTVVAVLHDLGLAANWADRVILIRDGAVVADGPPEATVTPTALADVYGVTASIHRHADGAFSIAVSGLATR